MKISNPNKSVSTINHLNKADKVIRWFKGRKVELPVKERKLNNKVSMNPTEKSDQHAGYYASMNYGN